MGYFTYNQPFRTTCGWPARLLGVLERTAFPYVVAVLNPQFDSEELHCYGPDGQDPSELREFSLANKESKPARSPLSLVNIADDEYFAVTQETEVHACIMPMHNFPPNSNPFHHDHSNMGTALVGGWTVMHSGYGPQPLRRFYLNHAVTGQNIKVVLTPKLKPTVSPLTIGE